MNKHEKNCPLCHCPTDFVLKKTLRDEFAMSALTGIVAQQGFKSQYLGQEKGNDKWTTGDGTFQVFGNWCYRMADAMLAAREQKNGN